MRDVHTPQTVTQTQKSTEIQRKARFDIGVLANTKNLTSEVAGFFFLEKTGQLSSRESLESFILLFGSRFRCSLRSAAKGSLRSVTAGVEVNYSGHPPPHFSSFLLLISPPFFSSFVLLLLCAHPRFFSYFFLLLLSLFSLLFIFSFFVSPCVLPLVLVLLSSSYSSSFSYCCFSSSSFFVVVILLLFSLIVFLQFSLGVFRLPFRLCFPFPYGTP